MFTNKHSSYQRKKKTLNKIEFVKAIVRFSRSVSAIEHTKATSFFWFFSKLFLALNIKISVQQTLIFGRKTNQIMTNQRIKNCNSFKSFYPHSFNFAIDIERLTYWRLTINQLPYARRGSNAAVQLSEEAAET